MQGVLYEHPNVFVFITLTLLMGGSAAFSAGKAIALAWHDMWRASLAAIGLSFAVRFLHFALFEGTLRSLQYWLVDLVILLVLAHLGWRLTRARQMVRQYPWLYEPAGPLGWRERAPG